jgi:hypothetical protein
MNTFWALKGKKCKKPLNILENSFYKMTHGKNGMKMIHIYSPNTVYAPNK